jgi:prepilin-type N-terminal cleavage/methylation domain-containing protein
MKKRAFTLLELLVVVAIIGVIAALLVTVLARSRRSGALAREISAGRQMVAAYVTAATDRDGQLMVGYASSEGATDELGHKVPNPACGRYPWRLAPYLQYRLKGVMLLHEQEKIADLQDRSDFVYRASAYPSFGINATYVGGNERMGLIPSPATLRYYGDFVARRLSHVSQPGKLIVFASARYSGDSSTGQAADAEAQQGFHLLMPPRTTKVDWSGKFDSKMPAEKFGSSTCAMRAAPSA